MVPYRPCVARMAGLELSAFALCGGPSCAERWKCVCTARCPATGRISFRSDEKYRAAWPVRRPRDISMERVCRAMPHDATSGRVALAKRCGSTLSQDACGALLSRSNAVLLSRRMPSWIEPAMRSSGLVDRCPMDIVRCRRCTGDCRYRSLHCSHARATATTGHGQSYAGPCGALETAEDLCVVQRHCGLIDTVKNH